jgi:hypothetical protein
VRRAAPGFRVAGVLQRDKEQVLKSRHVLTIVAATMCGEKKAACLGDRY